MMRSSLAATAAALLSALPSAYAAHHAVIQNYCDFDVYSWSVDTEQSPTEPTIINANGGVYREAFRTPAVGGVSIKLSPENNLYMPITQLEYTLNYDLWYDVSNVDCTGTECPFQKHGLYLHSGTGCPTVSCQAGNLTCHGAYTLWDDNWASLCCTEPTPDVYLYLCTDTPDPPTPEVPAPAPPAPEKAPKKAPVQTPDTVPSADVAGVTPGPKKPKQKPTPSEPVTEVYEVTEVKTVLVTVTPHPHQAREEAAHEHFARHYHNHGHAHAHHH